MTPDERRQAVQRMLALDPKPSQHAIAKRLGCSEKSISRDWGMQLTGVV